jgi:hypothetical protein
MSSASLRDDAFGALKSFSKLLIPRRLHPRLRRYYWKVGGLVRWHWSQICALAMATRFRRMPERAGRRVKFGGRPHTLPGPLIVSLTSYPPRFAILPFTLKSLLRQSVRADRTILWIAHADMPLLPKDVIDLRAAGLEIRATDDMRSYKKIIPALDAFPEAFICTADDDVYYWPTWLQELVKGHLAEGPKMTRRVVTCYRAHEIARDPQGRFQPYKQWTQDVFNREKSTLLFPTGIGGVLYPPGVLAHTRDDREAAFMLCPNNDDIWLYWIGRRNGATYKIVRRRREFVLWRGTEDQALWHSNFALDGNDVQIRKVAERYGYPAG